jgi:hypothetical protein
MIASLGWPSAIEEIYAPSLPETEEQGDRGLTEL